MAIQPLQVIGYAKEVTPGTFVIPTQFVPGIATIGTNNKIARPSQSRGTRAQVVDAIVGQETQVTIAAELIPEVLSGLIANWYGVGSDAISGSAGTGFTHTLTPKNALNSLSVEVDNDIFQQVLARQIAGCMVDQLTLRLQNQALATLEAALIGMRELTPATPGLPSNPTPSISTLQPMDFSLLAFNYKGSASTQLTDATLTLMNHVSRIFSSNQKLTASRLSPGQREVGLSTSLDFLDTNFYNDWFAGTKVATGITLSLVGPAIPASSGFFTVTFNLPGVRPNAQYGLQAASDVLQQQLDWSVTQQGANEINGAIINSESAALA
jgi:hypothetical protein